jgi:hypothetical protein
VATLGIGLLRHGYLDHANRPHSYEPPHAPSPAETQFPGYSCINAAARRAGPRTIRGGQPRYSTLATAIAPTLRVARSLIEQLIRKDKDHHTFKASPEWPGTWVIQ